jgi:hypothetical protein
MCLRASCRARPHGAHRLHVWAAVGMPTIIPLNSLQQGVSRQRSLSNTMCMLSLVWNRGRCPTPEVKSMACPGGSHCRYQARTMRTMVNIPGGRYTSTHDCNCSASTRYRNKAQARMRSASWLLHDPSPTKTGSRTKGVFLV